MSVTQYIGSRYVPLFADPVEWSSSNTYEPLTIVLHEGNSYTSKQAVPKGIAITNEAFWALTGNYNAQIEQYRRETAAVSAAVTIAQETADAAQTDIDTLLPKADFSAENTVKTYIDNSLSEIDEYINNNIFGNSRTLEISRFGRFISPSTDNIGFQTCFYHEGYYYITGAQGYIGIFNNNGILQKRYAVNVGHGNGIAVNSNYIVVADGNAPNIYVLNRASGELIRTIDYSIDLANCFGASYYDGNFYFTGYYRNSTKDTLFQLNLDDYGYSEICSYERPVVGARQDCCVYDGHLYAVYTNPNMIRDIDVVTGEVLNTYFTPRGDNIHQIWEIETILVVDGKLKIADAYYTSGMVPNYTSDTHTIMQLFDCNIIEPIVRQNAQDTNINIAPISINVNSNESYSFNPVFTVTTLLEAQIIANYLHGAVISISGDSFGRINLYDGIYTINGTSGNRNISLMSIKNAVVNINQVNISDIIAYDAQCTAQHVGFTNLLEAHRSDFRINACSLDANTLAMVRSSLICKNLLSINSNIAIEIYENGAGCAYEYKGKYLRGCASLAKFTGNAVSINTIRGGYMLHSQFAHSAILADTDQKANAFGNNLSINSFNAIILSPDGELYSQTDNDTEHRVVFSSANLVDIYSEGM